MTKKTVLRLPDSVATKVQEIVDRTGIPFATVCKSFVVERLKQEGGIKWKKYWRSSNPG